MAAGVDGVATSDSDTEQARHEALQKAARLTSLLGVAFAVSFLVGLALLARTPRAHVSDEELVAFYTSGEQRWLLIGGIYVLPLAAVAFLWFIAALRQWEIGNSRTLDQLLSTVQMLSGVGFITLAFAAAGAATIVASSVDLAKLPVDPAVARQFPLYSQTLLIIFGMRMAAIFVMTTAKLGHGAKLVPGWFQYVSYAVAAALFLVSTLNALLVVVFPLWILALCGIIWDQTRRAPAQGPVG
jgi:hypothetical protein